MAMQNPFMEAMAQGAQVANQSYANANNAFGQVSKILDTTGSLAIKMVTLLEQEEAQKMTALQNQQQILNQAYNNVISQQLEAIKTQEYARHNQEYARHNQETERLTGLELAEKARHNKEIENLTGEELEITREHYRNSDKAERLKALAAIQNANNEKINTWYLKLDSAHKSVIEAQKALQEAKDKNDQSLIEPLRNQVIYALNEYNHIKSVIGQLSGQINIPSQYNISQTPSEISQAPTTQATNTEQPRKPPELQNPNQTSKQTTKQKTQQTTEQKPPTINVNYSNGIVEVDGIHIFNTNTKNFTYDGEYFATSILKNGNEENIAHLATILATGLAATKTDENTFREYAKSILTTVSKMNISKDSYLTFAKYFANATDDEQMKLYSNSKNALKYLPEIEDYGMQLVSNASRDDRIALEEAYKPQNLFRKAADVSGFGAIDSAYMATENSSLPTNLFEKITRTRDIGDMRIDNESLKQGITTTYNQLSYLVGSQNARQIWNKFNEFTINNFWHKFEPGSLLEKKLPLSFITKLYKKEIYKKANNKSPTYINMQKVKEKFVEELKFDTTNDNGFAKKGFMHLLEKEPIDPNKKYKILFKTKSFGNWYITFTGSEILDFGANIFSALLQENIIKQNKHLLKEN